MTQTTHHLRAEDLASRAEVEPGSQVGDDGAGAPCCPPLAAGVLSTGDAERLAAMLKALADPVRLRLLSLVAAASDGEVCACDLPEAVDRSQSTVSHHLSQLVDAGLLQREQRGKWAWFRVDHAAIDDVAGALRLPGPGVATAPT